MIFLWVLTWYSYWIFMKQQINAINIIGAGISASLLVFSHFLPVRDAASKALKLAVSQNSKNRRLTNFFISSGSQSDIQVEMSPETLATPVQSACFDKVEEFPEQPTVIETQKQEAESVELAKELESVELAKEPESIELTDKSQQLPSKSSGCPKNLDYFTKKPRPKQTPEECFTCKNLITCVCLTDI
jgi:hypothetical protein